MWKETKEKILEVNHQGFGYIGFYDVNYNIGPF